MFSFDWAKRTHKGLRRWVLLIASEKPRNGVEIMDIMEANSQGWWRPSPGSIYPLLENMVKEGLLSKSEDKRYSLTQQGKEEFEHPFAFARTIPGSGPRSVEDVVGELSSYVSYLEDVAQTKRREFVANADNIRELGNRLTKLVSEQ
jgi:DNA-binding PadR family transcriptional regulator